MSIQIGQAAPDFTLFDSDKNPVKLSEQKGNNVLLLFFPQAFTSVCTKELCAVRDNIALYNNANAILNMKGVSKRSAFVIDKKGNIQYAEVLESAGDVPDFEKINAVLNNL